VDPVTIAIASGKGGTGKTTVAVNLALAALEPVLLLDCDVEEPNCHIFLEPPTWERETVGIPVPVVDEVKCNACGECGRICQYHAIVSLKTQPLVFPELCHGCGGCAKACPQGAITETVHEIGVVETGGKGWVELVQGRLHVGRPMSPPLIRAVKKHRGIATAVIDCPPGTSCPVITAMRGSDFLVLVTEPTPFGLHDLVLAVETAREIGIPFAVAVNRSDAGDGRVTQYCSREGIRVLLQLPEDRRLAEAYSRGKAAVEALPVYMGTFRHLWKDIREAAGNRAALGNRRGR
jgi:MinD superfamily P-loop ATPase